jgi:O-antigen/teichoic acid export membrane protein
LIVAVATSFFSNMVINLLFGAQYAEAGPVLAIYIWASVPVFLTVASNQYLIAENKTRVALFRTVAGSVVNVILNLILIPRLGMIGAAIAALTAYVVATFSMALTRELRTHMAIMGRSLNPAWLVRALRETSGS